ncbi:MAG: hypothetical protein US52_C0056G0005 [candidate division WS6 bacterium GW2011_GWA2_37_6]|uniref:Uncharacterized protein n=1 Tax=candidate division WS6 bacterium GW2011_GWA2_37_6 TaxID=1619087 RepID=A0A0G0H7I3_9BACT|nr:MAG: hypothetical protein US52_C0056G0005 [candidate division WS6 bacterium GW2011_GWA2_37_6]
MDYNSSAEQLFGSSLYSKILGNTIPGFTELAEQSPGIHPFLLEEALEDHVIGRKTMEVGFPLSTSQVYRSPDQILLPEEIAPGDVLFAMHNDKIRGVFKASAEACKDEEGFTMLDIDWFYDFIEGREGIDREKVQACLNDLGLAPYPANNLWNAWNWIMRLPDDPTVREEFARFCSSNGLS